MSQAAEPGRQSNGFGSRPLPRVSKLECHQSIYLKWYGRVEAGTGVCMRSTGKAVLGLWHPEH